MLKVYDEPENDPPPACRATVDLLQQVLDGDADPAALAVDPHPAACATCRDRVRAARLVLDVLAAPRAPAPVPAGFADRVLAAAAADRTTLPPRRFPLVGTLLALAAALLVAVWFVASNRNAPRGGPSETVRQPDPPTPQPPALAPAPREKAPPIRIGDEVAKASQAILDAPKPFADSVAAAPKLFDALTGTFKLPAAPRDPMINVLEPARKTLTELPVAARAGLEPVTGTAEKAFNRFLSDVGAVKPNS